jgi:hypothetical protein
LQRTAGPYIRVKTRLAFYVGFLGGTGRSRRAGG